jgi:hypothetical protein
LKASPDIAKQLTEAKTLKAVETIYDALMAPKKDPAKVNETKTEPAKVDEAKKIDLAPAKTEPLNVKVIEGSKVLVNPNHPEEVNESIQIARRLSLATSATK